ncbi:MAG: urea ABC transporter substrate-binding protein [Planctomycetia bacterium]|nr:urea ABC transporter substrate-binding protein [Planctomycetia bacterium]
MSDTPGSGFSRRDALRRGTAATLAAARALSPALFAGCSLGIPPRAKTVNVGLLHSQTGPLAISATGLRDIELHAFEQINAAGGLLGRQIVPHAPDPRSRVDLFPKRARRLLDEGSVAVFGCWTSTSRKAVLPIFEEAKKLLFYSVQYEGNESSPFVVYGGMVPNQQILPALDWLASAAGGLRKKIFLVGSDYVYPRTANFIAKKYLAAKSLKPVGTAYVPLGDRDFSGVVKQIRESGADCVLNTVNGDSNIGLFEALAEAKVDPATVPVVSTSIAEDELRSLLPGHVKGHYAVSCYFQSLDTPANRAWIAGFRREFGHDRVTGDPMEPDWCLVHLWKQAVEKAGSFETEAVRQVFREGLEFAGPGGPVRLDPKTQHTTKFCRIGRIRGDRQFDIVHTSPAPIDPDPYPEIAFPGWSVDWTKGGITRGAEVDIDGDV